MLLNLVACVLQLSLITAYNGVAVPRRYPFRHFAINEKRNALFNAERDESLQNGDHSDIEIGYNIFNQNNAEMPHGTAMESSSISNPGFDVIPASPVTPQSLPSAEWLFPRLSLLAMAAVCGTNFPLVKDLEEAHSEGSVAFVRFMLATLPFLGSLKCSNAVRNAGLEIGLWCSMGYITQAIGLHLTEASKGAFICALFMVVTPAVSPTGLAGVAAKEKGVQMSTWVAVAMALAGTCVLEVGGSGLSSGFAINAGDVWCLGTAIGFGLMFARMAKYMETMHDDVMALTAWQLIALSASMAVWYISTDVNIMSTENIFDTGISNLLSWSPKEASELLWMGFVTTAGVLWGETAVMSSVSAAEAGIIFASEPVFATAFASLLLRESLSATQYIGAALIILGCILSVVPQSGESSDDFQVNQR